MSEQTAEHTPETIKAEAELVRAETEKLKAETEKSMTWKDRIFTPVIFKWVCITVLLGGIVYGIFFSPWKIGSIEKGATPLPDKVLNK